MVGSAVAYASALLFGVPIYVVMKRLMKLTWWHTASAGGMCGFPYWLISEYPYSSTYFKYRFFIDFTVNFYSIEQNPVLQIDGAGHERHRAV